MYTREMQEISRRYDPDIRKVNSAPNMLNQKRIFYNAKGYNSQ